MSNPGNRTRARTTVRRSAPTGSTRAAPEPTAAPWTFLSNHAHVLICIADGLHDREIADLLSISPRTVQSHVLAILNKLGARSRPEAVAIALRSNLL